MESGLSAEASSWYSVKTEEGEEARAPFEGGAGDSLSITFGSIQSRPLRVVTNCRRTARRDMRHQPAAGRWPASR